MVEGFRRINGRQRSLYCQILLARTPIVCFADDFKFISTKMGHDFSVPINSILSISFGTRENSNL